MDLQATALEELGHQVAFAYFSRFRSRFLFRSDEDKDEIYYLDEIAPVAGLSSGRRLLSRIRSLRSVVAKANVDAVVAHGEGSAFVTAGLKGLVPTIAVLHVSISNKWQKTDRIRQSVYRAGLALALRLNSRTVVVSQAIKAQVRKFLGFKHAIVIQNCCDLSNLRSVEDVLESRRTEPGEKLTLVALGRISKEKNLSSLVRIASGLKAAGVAVRLLVVGDGSDRTDVLKAAASTDLSLEDLSQSQQPADPTRTSDADIVITGFVGDPSAWVDRADLFVMPSFAEGYPLAMIEALAAGVPAFASDCLTGPREIFELPARDMDEPAIEKGVVVPQRGMLLPIPTDPMSDAEWIDAVRTYAHAQDLRDRVAVDVSQERERFGLDRFARRWAEVLAL